MSINLFFTVRAFSWLASSHVQAATSAAGRRRGLAGSTCLGRASPTAFPYFGRLIPGRAYYVEALASGTGCYATRPGYYLPHAFSRKAPWRSSISARASWTTQWCGPAEPGSRMSSRHWAMGRRSARAMEILCPSAPGVQLSAAYAWLMADGGEEPATRKPPRPRTVRRRAGPRPGWSRCSSPPSGGLIGLLLLAGGIAARIVSSSTVPPTPSRPRTSTSAQTNSTGPRRGYSMFGSRWTAESRLPVAVSGAVMVLPGHPWPRYSAADVSCLSASPWLIARQAHSAQGTSKQPALAGPFFDAGGGCRHR